MRRRKNVFASIDLGTAEIKLLIVQKGFAGLKTLLMETYPRHEISTVSQKIQQYRPKEVILLLPQERVIVRDLTIPPVDKNRIKSILYFELSGLLPYTMEQVELDYLVVQRSRKEMKVKAFVIPDYLLRESLTVIKDTGIEITRIIPRGLAITSYCKEEKLLDRLIKLSNSDGEIVVYPDYSHYFVQFFNSGQNIDAEDLRNLLKSEGIEPARWDFLELSQNDLEMKGAIYFYQKNSKFTLYRTASQKNVINWSKIGIIFMIIAILATNIGTIYLKYSMKKSELALYEERMKLLTPRVEKVKQLKTEVTQVKEQFEQVAKMEEDNWNYLVWLKELHILLQEDTEVNILVFEGNLLKELHGKAPSATRVSERLAKSPYFASPEFTSPITPKEENGVIKEEFSITALLIDPQRKGEEGND